MSSREHQEVSERERQYQDGSDPKMLDVIDIALKEPKPQTYQSENWLLDPEFYWVKRSEFALRDLDGLVDPVEHLWWNGLSTHHGKNDKIHIETANQLDHSLRLIKVAGITISVFVPGAAFGDPKRRVQASFEYNKHEYRLWVTDPKYEKRFLLLEDGVYTLGECFVTVSIGEPHQGYCYKLVAGIIES